MIPYGRHCIEDDDVRAVAEVLRGALLTQGPKAAELERMIQQMTGARHAIVVANGTAALHLACLAAEIGPGDTLATSPITFLASANCALYVGARPVFTDIDCATLNMDPAALQAAFAAAPLKAVVPVHFAGLPCDMETIGPAARRHGAVVIEDACHALGSTYADGSPVGSCRHSDMTTFSFHPVKLIAAGEGGAITTNDSTLYRRLQLLRNHGMTREAGEFRNREAAFAEDGRPNPWYYEMQALGYNVRITDIQCALAISQFRKLDRFLARRRDIARRYDEAFAGLPGLELPQKAHRQRSANHLYAVRIDYARLGRTRAEVMLRLAAKGVGSQVHYIPVPDQPYYRDRGLGEGNWPQARAYYEQALTIPLYYGMSEEDIALVIESVRDILAGGGA